MRKILVVTIAFLITTPCWSGKIPTCRKLQTILFKQCIENAKTHTELSHLSRDQHAFMIKDCSETYNQKINECHD
jgi:hypothetical protein